MRAHARRPRIRPEAARRHAARDRAAAVVRPRPSAAGARHEPRRVAVRRPARALSHLPRHDDEGPADRLVPLRRHDRERAPHRALRDRGARARSGRERGTGGHRRDRGPARGDDRRDDRRPRRSAAAARLDGRRAVALDHDRHQHVAARRHGGRPADRVDGEAAARPGARRQRQPARQPDRAPRRVGGAGPRRAAARGARRADAPRRLRAHGRQAGSA